MECRNVHTLHLDRKDLTEVPGDIPCQVRVLSLSGNRLSNFHNLCKVSQLVELNLFDNGLNGLPDSFSSLQSMRLLEVSHNNLSDLGIVSTLTNLRTLYAHKNRISSLPQLLPPLEGLYLSCNRIEEIPLSVCCLSSLTGLSFSSNSLSKLPEEVTRLTNLKKLYLAKNNIPNVPLRLSSLPYLHTLDLRHNQLTRVSAEYFLHLIPVLRVAEGNPLSELSSAARTSDDAVREYLNSVYAICYPGAVLVGPPSSGKSTLLNNMNQCIRSNKTRQGEWGRSVTWLRNDSGMKEGELTLWYFNRSLPQSILMNERVVQVLVMSVFPELQLEDARNLWRDYIAEWADLLLATVRRCTIIVVGTYADKLPGGTRKQEVHRRMCSMKSILSAALGKHPLHCIKNVLCVEGTSSWTLGSVKAWEISEDAGIPAQGNLMDTVQRAIMRAAVPDYPIPEYWLVRERLRLLCETIAVMPFSTLLREFVRVLDKEKLHRYLVALDAAGEVFYCCACCEDSPCEEGVVFLNLTMAFDVALQLLYLSKCLTGRTTCPELTEPDEQLMLFARDTRDMFINGCLPKEVLCKLYSHVYPEQNSGGVRCRALLSRLALLICSKRRYHTGSSRLHSSTTSSSIGSSSDGSRGISGDERCTSSGSNGGGSSSSINEWVDFCPLLASTESSLHPYAPSSGEKMRVAVFASPVLCCSSPLKLLADVMYMKDWTWSKIDVWEELNGVDGSKGVFGACGLTSDVCVQLQVGHGSNISWGEQLSWAKEVNLINVRRVIFLTERYRAGTDVPTCLPNIERCIRRRFEVVNSRLYRSCPQCSAMTRMPLSTQYCTCCHTVITQGEWEGGMLGADPQVFLCHGSYTKPFAVKVYDRLVLEGVNAFVDCRNMLTREVIIDNFIEEVENSAIVVILVSRFLVLSKWCMAEIQAALRAEGRYRVLPVFMSDLWSFEWVKTAAIEQMVQTVDAGETTDDWCSLTDIQKRARCEIVKSLTISGAVVGSSQFESVDSVVASCIALLRQVRRVPTVHSIPQ